MVRKTSKSRLGKIVAMLLIIAFVMTGAWMALPLSMQNAFLSNLCDNFYAPVFEEDIPIWKDVHRTIVFSPAYYGEYGLFVVVDGTMSDLAYPVKSMPGKLSATVTQDGGQPEIVRDLSWDGALQHNDGKTAYRLFAFRVEKNVREVTLDLRITEPFTYFQTRQPVRVVVKSAYQM